MERILLQYFDVTAMGELLVDCTQNGCSAQGNPMFEANPGGAPCNVLAMLAKLGRRTAFLGKVGADSFGHFLADTLAGLGIDAAGLAWDPVVHTTLAFVHTAPDGERDFSFYRRPGADTRLKPEELRLDRVAGARIFHFGSLSLTDEPARSATQRAVAAARQAGALLSFDPNLRAPLWPDLAIAKEQMDWGCAQCAVLKVAQEELAFLSGEEDIPAGARALLARHPQIQLLLVTQGKYGSQAFAASAHAALPAFHVQAVDTTGAGDAFCGCCLTYLLSHPLQALREAQLREMLRFANAAAALVTTKKGALRAMPAPEEIAALLAAQP